MRGTPQQIIDKYNQLARDAQLANDRVATENFQQHAEHYLRILNEAQKEMEARREQQERENRERQQERDRERALRQEREAAQAAEAAQKTDPAEEQDRQLDVTDGDQTQEEEILVETPEETPKPRKSRRAPSTRKPRKTDEKAESSDSSEKPAAE